jgi:hypothetical protein
MTATAGESRRYPCWKCQSVGGPCLVCQGTGAVGPPTWAISPHDRKLHAFYQLHDNMAAEATCTHTVPANEIQSVLPSEVTNDLERCTPCLLNIGISLHAFLGDAAEARELRDM